MKRLSFCLAILMLLSFGIAFAQPPGNTFIRLGTPLVDNVPSVGDTLFMTTDQEVKFPFIYGNRDTIRYNTSNAFIIFSDADGILEPAYYTHRGDGTATWAWPTANGGNVKGLGTGLGMWIDTTGFYHKSDFPQLYKFTLFGADGSGADTMQWSGAGGLDDTGAVTPAAHRRDSGIFMYLKIKAKIADSNKFICIDSSANYPPSGAWKWPAFGMDTAAHQEAYNAFPTWSGAKCFQIKKQQNVPPDITACPANNLTGSHCGSFSTVLKATDAEGNPIVWSIVSGPGGVAPVNGDSTVYTATGLTTGTHTVQVGATDPSGSGKTTLCQFDIIATNVGPAIHCPLVKTVSTGEATKDTITATDDCDGLTFFINSSTAEGATIAPGPAGVAYVSYTGDTADVAGSPVCVNVGVTDGKDTAYCDACFNVVKGCKYKVRIEKNLGGGSGVLQGTVANVGVYLDAADGVSGLGGFDLLIAYDNSVSVLPDCCWWRHLRQLRVGIFHVSRGRERQLLRRLSFRPHSHRGYCRDQQWRSSRRLPAESVQHPAGLHPGQPAVPRVEQPHV